MHTVEKLIRDYYDALNRGDWAAVLALLADDVIHDVNQGEREVGKQRFAEFLEQARFSCKEKVREVVVMVGSDLRRAAAEYLVEGHWLQESDGHPEGQSFLVPGGAFFEVRNGHIGRITSYESHRREVAPGERPG